MESPIRGGAGVAAMLTLGLACIPAQAQSGADERVMLPGTGYEIILEANSGSEPTPPSQDLIEAVSTWLSSSLNLPAISQPPRFRFVTPDAMAALRHSGAVSGHKADVTIGADRPETSGMRDVLAFYDDGSGTIYLRDDWSGGTAAELSIVVHEMVHHLQNLANLKFECYEAREKQAFAAQEQWLALFGKELATEFGLDPLTLIVRTNCSF